MVSKRSSLAMGARKRRQLLPTPPTCHANFVWDGRAVVLHLLAFDSPICTTSLTTAPTDLPELDGRPFRQDSASHGTRRGTDLELMQRQSLHRRWKERRAHGQDTRLGGSEDRPSVALLGDASTRNSRLALVRAFSELAFEVAAVGVAASASLYWSQTHSPRKGRSRARTRRALCRVCKAKATWADRRGLPTSICTQ